MTINAEILDQNIWNLLIGYKLANVKLQTKKIINSI